MIRFIQLFRDSFIRTIIKISVLDRWYTAVYLSDSEKLTPSGVAQAKLKHLNY